MPERGLSAAEVALLEESFKHHAPVGDQAERYADNRQWYLALAKRICNNCPSSDERRKAISLLRSSMFWANASIALERRPVNVAGDPIPTA